MLTWSDNAVARLWDAKDGTPLGEPMQHPTQRVIVSDSFRGAFTKDEDRVLTWSDDGTARLWLAKDGSPLGQPMRHETKVMGAVSTSDEEGILTWSGDAARLWSIIGDYDFPVEHIPLLVEMITGTTMDNFGNVSVLDSAAWNEKRTRYIAVASKHSSECKFSSANVYLRQKQLWAVSK